MSVQERRENEALERSAQQLADSWYRARGHEIVDRQGCIGWDLVLRVNNKEFRVEEKFRSGNYGDVLVEVVQDIVTGNLGWLYHTRCVWLHYFICEGHVPQVLYRIHWPAFSLWFKDYVRDVKHLKWVKSTRGWGITINVAVPIADIPVEMMRKFDIELPASAA